jgi:methylglutaconyl-CoA hydratase
MSDSLRTDRRPDGVVRVTLSRPDLHNAFDDRLIVELTQALARLGEDEGVRALVLTGAGKSFSAGADLDWMRRMAGYSDEENLGDARALARLMQTLNELPMPTVARVNGAALGGGAGLVACCDIAIASEAASFGTTEARLGIIPAEIIDGTAQRIARLRATGEAREGIAAFLEKRRPAWLA